MWQIHNNYRFLWQFTVQRRKCETLLQTQWYIHIFNIHHYNKYLIIYTALVSRLQWQDPKIDTTFTEFPSVLVMPPKTFTLLCLEGSKSNIILLYCNIRLTTQWHYELWWHDMGERFELHYIYWIFFLADGTQEVLNIAYLTIPIYTVLITLKLNALID